MRPGRQADVWRLNQAGWSHPAIAEKLDLARGTVRVYLCLCRERGGPPNPPQPTKRDRAAAFRVLGLSYHIIAERLQTTSNAVGIMLHHARRAEAVAAASRASSVRLSVESQVVDPSVAFANREGNGPCRQENGIRR